MERKTDTFKQFAEIIEGVLQPQRICDNILKVAVSLTESDRGAVFEYRPHEELGFRALFNVDEASLKSLKQRCKQAAFSFEQHGEIVRAMRPSNAIFGPVWEGDRLVGIVYVESLQGATYSALDHEYVSQLGRLLSPALRSEGTHTLSSDQDETVRQYLASRGFKEIERDKWTLIIEQSGWNLAEVVRRTGIPRRTLYSKIEKLGIKRPKGARRHRWAYHGTPATAE